MADPSFVKLASATASTKRNPAIVGGKVGVPVTNLTDLKILPLMPVTPDIVERYKIESPRESYMTFIEGAPDILEGDVLVVSSTSYRVQAVGPWPSDLSFYQIICEEVKGE